MFRDNYYCNFSFWADLDVFVRHVSSFDSNLGLFSVYSPQSQCCVQEINQSARIKNNQQPRTS